MFTKLLFVVAITTFLFVNVSYGQFNWIQPWELSGSITTETYEGVDMIVVNGSNASDRVKVERLGGAALVSLYGNGRLVAQKLVQNNNSVGMLNGDVGIFRRGKELWLKAKLKGGNNTFLCDSPIFDQIEVYTDDGDDTIFAGPASTIAFAGGGNDVIYGGPQSDWLLGEDGNDFIRGGEGNDFLEGGNGSDMLSGIGSGQIPEGQDTIYPGNWYGYQDSSRDNFWADFGDRVYSAAGDIGYFVGVN